MKIYIAKKIYTADKAFSDHQAMVVDGKKIVELGEATQLMTKYPKAEVNKEFENDFIYPGFIEPHLHTVSTGAMFASLIPASFTEWTIGDRTYPAVRT